uniref:Uncharacterized protein n=1 Tax=Equus asinus TaxID=9793 RepID=A0A8C4LI80_EQUAS
MRGPLGANCRPPHRRESRGFPAGARSLPPGSRMIAKKARAGQEDPGTPPSSPLSPEQLDRIQRNKAAALRRLAARNVPVGFGESWKRHLSGGFGKPYFIKLMGFVAEERRHHTVYPPPHQVVDPNVCCLLYR